MTRRRLRMINSSSDEEDNYEHHQPPPQPHQQDEEFDDIEVEIEESTLNLETVTLNTPNPNPIPNPVQLEISDDDDFIDVPDHLSPPPQPPPPPPPVADHHSFQSSFASSVNSNNSGVQDSDSTISGFLARLGLRLKGEWLDSCVGGLESSVAGFGGLDVAGKAKLCFEQFLFSDMNYSGDGILPENVHNLHLIDLPGPFVLQVDEIVNLSCPLKGRYQNAPSGHKRCLKLSMTDGVQRVFGMEYRPIKDLEVLAPAGMKVAICNVHVRRGILMLVPEVIEVLGGVVEDLEAARQRLVHEVNKPPRGKRTRTGVVPPLAARATLAAWPPDSVSAPSHTNNPLSQAAAPPPAPEQDRAPGVSTRRERTTEDFAVPISRENTEPNIFSTFVSDSEDTHMVDRVDQRFTPTADIRMPFSRESTEPNLEEIHMVDKVAQPFRPTAENQPFTYLASLSAKWATVKDNSANVQGRIKCFMTAVKGFQFKHRAMYELLVYVDDGSLISEILIDHHVVQNGIGHSPEEVTAALTSSDTRRVSDIKVTLKEFQRFLANFEGTMVVQISEASPCPVAIEMKEGCRPSDAWLLLRRLQSSNSAQPQQHSLLDPINLSP